MASGGMVSLGSSSSFPDTRRLSLRGRSPSQTVHSDEFTDRAPRRFMNEQTNPKKFYARRRCPRSRAAWPAGSGLLAPATAHQVAGAAGVDHPVRPDAVPFSPRAATVQPVELAGGVRVAVDGEQAADLGRQAQQPVRRVLALGPAVDLDRDAVIVTGGEHPLRVELRLRPAAAAQHPPGAVAQ